jgi:50S ribosomal subunit-associated GTPase HflX
VWNKADKAGFAAAQQLCLGYGGVAISAQTGEGLEALLLEAAACL